MRKRPIVIALVAAFVASFIGFSRPLAVHAACATYTGSYLSTATPFTSAPFTYNVGDTVSATNTPAGSGITGVGLEININATTYVFGGGGSTSASGSHVATGSGSGTVFFLNVNNAPGAPVTMKWTITVGVGCGGGVEQLTFDDGRENSHDGQETAAVYCEDDGGVTLYAIYQSQGYFAFHVSPDELDEIPEHPAKNTLIKQGLGVALYRLTSGELQINSTNDYVFIWDGC